MSSKEKKRRAGFQGLLSRMMRRVSIDMHICVGQQEGSQVASKEHMSLIDESSRLYLM